jgi:hypothetical protein
MYQSFAMESQVSPEATTCQLEQSDTVSAAAVVGGGSKYAATDDACIASANTVYMCLDNIFGLRTMDQWRSQIWR